MSGNKFFACYMNCMSIPQRYITAIMGCLAIVNAYLMRQCLATTITQLVIPRNYTKKQIYEEAVCEPDEGFLNGKKAGTGDRDWDQNLQAIILGSFYIGYLLTHLPGGILADKYGSKWVLSLGILFTSLFTLLTPLAIDYGDAWGLIIMRIMLGAGGGTTFPASSVLMADWIPSKERGILGALVMSGAQLGSIISHSVSGYMLVQYHWAMVFYVWGIVAVLWFVFFIFICYNTPFKHPCIKESEKEMLRQQIGDASAKRRSLPSTPYKRIFTSGPVWALISAHIGHDWAFYSLVSYLPKYMNDVLQMDIHLSGVLSSLPNVIMWICSIACGFLADIIIKSGCLGTSATRKVMTGTAAFATAIFLIAASYSGCNRVAVTLNLCFAMGMMGGYYGGMMLSPMDMSPNYAGTIMAIANGIGSIAGLLGSLTVGWMTPNWHNVFWVVFVILSVTATHYCIFGKSEIQPWNEPEKTTERSLETKTDT